MRLFTVTLICVIDTSEGYIDLVIHGIFPTFMGNSLQVYAVNTKLTCFGGSSPFALSFWGA